MPAVQPHPFIIEPIWEQFRFLLPDRASVHLDRAYDSLTTRQKLEARSLIGEISRKGKPAPVSATKRWTVERTNS